MMSGSNHEGKLHHYRRPKAGYFNFPEIMS
jgi:hypothetical protein